MRKLAVLRFLLTLIFQLADLCLFLSLSLSLSLGFALYKMDSKWKLRKPSEKQKTTGSRSKPQKQREEYVAGGVCGRRVVWKCIGEIQRGRRGLVPVRKKSVKDEEGHTCNTPQHQHDLWRRHFTNLLNIVSKLDETEMEQTRQRPPRPGMADPPTFEELEKAISKLCTGKAAGLSGILPEMVKAACGNANFFNHLLELTTAIWNRQQVPQDRVDAVLIPISKKGDLSNCDNWRGLHYLMLLVMQWQQSCKSNYKYWLNKSFQSRNVAFIREGAALT